MMEQRLIDANALEKAAEEYCSSCFSLGELEMAAKDIGINIYVDAVPVVRCGECLSCEAHFKRNGEVHFHRCSFFDIEIEPQDFCSYGERRDSDG